mmetsp:Transcript_35534/g.85970  ORF Transcript_35534/g.85970 Transcript_35534/m.85970 type:complete len:908 (+) Transcript_35534:196-2919(+)
MGIKGLHKALSFCTVKDNLRNYQNQRVAIDASAWLHRSVYSVAEELAETPRNRVNEKCVRVSCNYMISRCLELVDGWNVGTIFLVTDGRRSPMKSDESQDRDRKQQQTLQEARQYKRSGQRYKAEEKYKACVRIRENFAAEVVKRLKREFKSGGKHGNKNIYIVEAPYEADAQLCKLMIDNVADFVITEDSDVLAYSAAAHVAFPILYKLDRSTGNCDRISMDWLLSPNNGCSNNSNRIDNNSKNSSRNPSSTSSSNPSSIESIMRRLADRQSARAGRGVRLFVQACVLAGCDYSINKLDGVGLINAFKYIRDHAVRNDTVRFRKVLESLPRKLRHSLDIDQYEETLAKSEAVFFYHYVLHTDGDVKPMLPPRLSKEESTEEHHLSDHFPFMERFEDDWSFLGVGTPVGNSINETVEETNPQTKSLPSITNFVATARSNFKKQGNADVSATNLRSSKGAAKATTKVMQNPYLKPTTATQHEGHSNFRSNRTSSANAVTDNPPTSQQCNTITQYLKRDIDYRISQKPRASQQLGSTNLSSNRRTSSFFSRQSQQHRQMDQNMSSSRSFSGSQAVLAPFQYNNHDLNDGNDDDDDDDHDTLSLNLTTTNNHENGGSDFIGEDAMFGFDTYKKEPTRSFKRTTSIPKQDSRQNEPARAEPSPPDYQQTEPVVTEASDDSCLPNGAKPAQDSTIDLTEDDDENLQESNIGSGHFASRIHTNTSSRGADHRRVTLSPKNQQKRHDEEFLEDIASSADDDIMDSPESVAKTGPFSHKEVNRQSCSSILPTETKQTKKRREKSGPLDVAFRRQAEFSSRIGERSSETTAGSKKRNVSQLTWNSQTTKKLTPSKKKKKTKKNQEPSLETDIQQAMFKSFFQQKQRQPQPQPPQLTINIDYNDGKSNEDWMWTGDD